jgi:TetR/AcrR family transcriptional regulator, transcriptional repressor of bet genes
MPKLGMEPIRRDALVKATIAEIGRARSLDVTVAQIAKRAGMSSALAHHYFGTKEHIFEAAMRRVMAIFAQDVRKLLKKAPTPKERVEAVIRASFLPSNFEPAAIAAWLQFYVYAQTPGPAKRLLKAYIARLRSNLIYGLRPIVGPRAEEAADLLGALIDGIYIRAALSTDKPNGKVAEAMVVSALNRFITGKP